MGCCQSQHKWKGGINDKRRMMDHFMPPGAPQQPRYMYRLEKVEDLDLEKLRSHTRIEMQNMASSDSTAAAQLLGRPINAYEQFEEEGELLVEITDGEDDPSPSIPSQSLDDRGAAAKAALLEAIGQQLQDRLGTYDAPVVGEDRYLLVETPVGLDGGGSCPCITRSCTSDEETLVREVQEEALKGLLFISNTLALATYENTGNKVEHLLLEPLTNDAGIDFESILATAREKAMAGWRLRGALRGRAQVQDVVLAYAMFPDVVVSPFSHLVFSQDAGAVRLQLEMVELRGTGSIITSTLIRVVRAWARRGWRITSLVYNMVTTYDKVALDPADAATCDAAGGQLMPDSRWEGLFAPAMEIGGNGELALYYNVAVYFERLMAANDQGKMQATLALQEREQSLQSEGGPPFAARLPTRAHR